MSTIDILFIPVGKPAEKRTINNDLKTMQGLVEGYIEALQWGRKGLYLYFNEEGRFRDMAPNIPVIGMMPNILGNAFLARIDKNGNSISVTQEDIDLYYKHIEKARRIVGLVSG